MVRATNGKEDHKLTLGVVALRLIGCLERLLGKGSSTSLLRSLSLFVLMLQ